MLCYLLHEVLKQVLYQLLYQLLHSLLCQLLCQLLCEGLCQLQGALRVSRFNPFEGWVGSESVGQDILISGRVDMNR